MPQIKSTDLAINTVITSTNEGDKTLTIVMQAGAPLKPGRYTFRLAVEDDSGNKSATNGSADVIILDQLAPTAIARPALQSVSFGKDFTLDGSESADVGGRVVRWEWTLVERP